MVSINSLYGLGGFGFGLLAAVLLPNKQFERYQDKWGIPFDPQTIYYKGNVDSQPPPDIGQIVRPVEGRILKKLKAMDMAEDEEMEQATERHDDMLLEIERKELEWVEQHSDKPTKQVQTRMEEYEAAKRVQAKRAAEGKN